MGIRRHRQLRRFRRSISRRAVAWYAHHAASDGRRQDLHLALDGRRIIKEQSGHVPGFRFDRREPRCRTGTGSKTHGALDEAEKRDQQTTIIPISTAALARAVRRIRRLTVHFPRRGAPRIPRLPSCPASKPFDLFDPDRKADEALRQARSSSPTRRNCCRATCASCAASSDTADPAAQTSRGNDSGKSSFANIARG